MQKILIVEDDRELNRTICYALKKEGYDIYSAYSVCEAKAIYRQEKMELILLDVNLPDGEGFSLCRWMKGQREVPVLFLTARDLEEDALEGYGSGAEDYITKPFKLAVFLSRINALLRRSDHFNQPDTGLKSNGIYVNLLKGEAYKDGMQLDLTASEYKLLCLFMENPDVVLTPEQILSRLWDCDTNYIDNNSLTVYIRRLRTKIEDNPSEPKNLVTVRRMGYRWYVRD